MKFLTRKMITMIFATAMVFVFVFHGFGIRVYSDMAMFYFLSAVVYFVAMIAAFHNETRGRGKDTNLYEVGRK